MPALNPTLTHSIPMTEECFVHFSRSLRQFGDMPTYQANGFNISHSDLSLERMVKLNGRRPFLCWVRTSHRFEKNLSPSFQMTSGGPQKPFDQLVWEYARRTTCQVFGSMGPGNFLSFVDPVEAKPERKADVVCRVLSGAILIEIQFWFGEDISPF
jgi:hypothetical protein